MLQRNLGRRITRAELAYLAGSEIWHEFMYRVLRGECIALPWGYVEEGPLTPQELETFIAEGLAPLHAERKEEDAEPKPVAPPTYDPRKDRVRAAEASRRRLRNPNVF